MVVVTQLKARRHHERLDDKVDACVELDLYLLRIDLTDARCPPGCCRQGIEILEFLNYDDEDRFVYSKRIEIVRALEAEQQIYKDAITRMSQIPHDRIIFVNAR